MPFNPGKLWSHKGIQPAPPGAILTINFGLVNTQNDYLEIKKTGSDFMKTHAKTETQRTRKGKALRSRSNQAVFLCALLAALSLRLCVIVFFVMKEPPPMIEKPTTEQTSPFCNPTIAQNWTERFALLFALCAFAPLKSILHSP